MCIQFTNEKALEDYICENNALDDFFYKEFTNYNIIGIELIGQQIRIDNSHIIDLLYYCDVEQDNKLVRFYLVVELKNVIAKPNDLCQLSRYTGILEDCINMKDLFNNNSYADEFVVLGYLVAPDFTTELSDISSSHNLVNIRFVKIIPDFSGIKFSWKEEYIKDLKLDERIIKTLQNGNVEDE